MTTDRWDPFREMVTFREAMDRWLQQSISGTGQLLSNMRPESIPIDAIERDDAFEVRAALPGVRPEDVEVTVQGERVTIRAEARPTEDAAADNWLMREHRFGLMQRSITLPAPVSSERAQARMDNGVLSLRLPKTEGVAARRISVASSAAPEASPTPQVDRVTEASQESFPASDPPSFTPGQL